MLDPFIVIDLYRVINDHSRHKEKHPVLMRFYSGGFVVDQRNDKPCVYAPGTIASPSPAPNDPLLPEYSKVDILSDRMLLVVSSERSIRNYCRTVVRRYPWPFMGIIWWLYGRWNVFHLSRDSISCIQILHVHSNSFCTAAEGYCTNYPANA